MTIEVDVRDINGAPLHIGDKVMAYAKEFEIRRRETLGGGTRVVEVASERPKPVKDVPLFAGRIVWSADTLSLQVRIEKMYVHWESRLSSVSMSHYLYERV
jgi:hypothetical protein